MNYSVVICSYNKLEYLKRVVASLEAIGGPHEYILSDDCSTDGTLEWVENGGFFDKVVTMEEDLGYCLNTVRNQGIRAATNKFVVLLDADCVPEKHYFEGHDRVFESGVRKLSVGFTNFYDEVGESMVMPDHRFNWLGEKDVCKIGWMSAYGGNMAISKKLWTEVGEFDESFNGAWGLDDAEFAYRVHLVEAQIVGHRLSCVRHLRHPHSGTEAMRSGRGPNTVKFKKKHGFSPC